MNKNLLAVVVAVLIIGGAVGYVSQPETVSDQELETEASLEDNREEDEINEENSENYEEEEIDEEMSSLIDCLAEEDLVIYGMQWCPACSQLVDSFGGYEAAEPIYVECTEEEEICRENTQTEYVPEIQIDGELYEGPRDPSSLASEVNCEV